MMHGTERPQLGPNRAHINEHLYALFAPEFVKDYPDAWIEIAFADMAGNGKPDAAEHFSPFDLQKAVDFAEAKNRDGFNIYVGPALRHGNTGLKSNGRSSGANFLASAYAWADFDGEGDYSRINDVLEKKNLPVSKIVMTGRTPHERGHPYFKINGKATKDQLRDINTGLKKLLNTDHVEDPCRVMRLAGTVSYPPPDKVARGYIAELVTLHIRKNMPAYTVGQLLALAGADTGDTSNLFGFNTRPGRRDDELIATLEASRIKGKWHNSIRDAIATMIGRGWSDTAIRLVCAPYCKGEFGDRDLDLLIDGARTKWRKPDEEPAAQSAGPVEPVDLWGNFEPPTLPRGLLPELIEKYAVEQAATMGADPGGIAMAALATCAAAIPDKVELMMKPHSRSWTESARLWVGLVGLPSTKKTPIIRAAVQSLAKLDAVLVRKFLAEMLIYNQLDREERKTEPKPVQKRLRLEDTTIEAAQEALAGSPNGVLMVQDELSGFFGAMDKYGGHHGAAKDRSFWLQSYNGGEYALNRINRGVGLIPNLSVSLLGGIQPDVIRRLSSESYDDGLLQRML